MPPRPSAPSYGPSRLYQSGYSNTIAQLLARQGDIAAEGAARSGAIWGPAVANLGQQAGQYLQQRAEVKTQEARRAAFETALAGFDPANPMATYRSLAVAVGPEPAVKILEGIASIRKLQQAEKPDFEDLKITVSGLAATKAVQGDEYLRQHWPTIRGAIAPAVKAALGIDLPEEWSDEVPKGIDALNQAWNAPKGAAKPEGAIVETVDAAGQPVKRRATEEELAAGVPMIPPKEPVDVEGRMIRAEERKAIRDEQKATEKAAADERKATEKAATAARENDAEVKAAFAAMDVALQRVEKFAGAKAVTSPLEAAYARRQFENSTKAFAATLSRATGDTRISDLDRRAYADLVAYSGPGSGLVNITRPDLVRESFNQAKAQFEAASKARTPAPAAPAGAVSREAIVAPAIQAAKERSSAALPGPSVPPQPGEQPWELGPDGIPRPVKAQ